MDSQTNFFEENICKRCQFILKNIVKINSRYDCAEDSETSYLKTTTVKELETKKNNFESSINLQSIENFSDKENFLCKFCFGILNEKKFEEITSIIQEKISEFQAEHKNFNLTSNFSALFLLIHSYLKLNLQKENYSQTPNYLNPSNIEYLDITLIRKLFKPLFLPFLCKKIQKESSSQKSTLEIKIIFEFKADFYKEVFKAFSYNTAMKRIGEYRFRPNIGITSQSNVIDRGNINDIIKSCSSDLFFEVFGKIFKNYLNINDVLDIRVEAINTNILLKGNYLKYSREIGQTPWSTNGQKVCFTSVQDEMAKTLSTLFDCTDCILHAGGREDRDVRMLGSGRPFIIELRLLENIKNVEKELNNNTQVIQVENLDSCDQAYFDEIKEFEISKKKFYTCVVWTSRKIEEKDLEKINAVRDMEIIQKTPIRVMHRRTLMDRKKIILKLDAKLIINVLSSAGTYIKEFIHSDLGRTNPSLPSILGCDCDILQLDVMNIIYDN